MSKLELFWAKAGGDRQSETFAASKLAAAEARFAEVRDEMEQDAEVRQANISLRTGDGETLMSWARA